MALTKAIMASNQYPQERPILLSVHSFDDPWPLLSELDPPRPQLGQHHGHCLGFCLYGTVEEDLV